jgi:hypothetical protein
MFWGQEKEKNEKISNFILNDFEEEDDDDIHLFYESDGETEIILNTLKRKQEENQFSESLKLKK